MNGSEGIGTLWCTFVQNYNPTEIIANHKWILNGEAMGPMDRWSKWFKGTILENHIKGQWVYRVC